MSKSNKMKIKPFIYKAFKPYPLKKEYYKSNKNKNLLSVAYDVKRVCGREHNSKLA
jgi:hypothetical protein